MKVKVDAWEIKKALEKKHRLQGDMFFTEVKSGKTWNTNNLLIIDALALKKSWRNQCVTGYEIKVDRQDFLRDTKWPGYRNMCNKLFFCCPDGLISPTELSEDVGLIYFNPEKQSIRTKKQAVFRDVEISKDMLLYIIMSRVEPDRCHFFKSSTEQVEAYLQEKDKRQNIGHILSTKMARDLLSLQHENERLKKFQAYKNIVDEIKKILYQTDIYVPYDDKLPGAIESLLKNGYNVMPKKVKEIDRCFNDFKLKFSEFLNSIEKEEVG